MFAIIIGDSPDHIIKLNQIDAILTHVSNIVSDEAILSINEDVTFTADQISDLSEWVKDMIYSLNHLSDSAEDNTQDYQPIV